MWAGPGETIQATRNTGTMAIQFNDSVRRPCFVFRFSERGCKVRALLSEPISSFFFPDRNLLGMMKRVFLFLAGLRLLGKRRVRNGLPGSLCLLARRGSPRFTSDISVEKREECSFFVTVTPFTRACKCLTNGGSQRGVNRMK